MTKKEIRKIIKSRLIAMSDEEKSEKSKIIENRVCGAQVFKDSRSVFIYMADNIEVQTKGIIKAAQLLGKKVYIPLVVGEDMSIAELFTTFDRAKFTENEWGIKELAEPFSIGKPDDVDLVIVPVVGCTIRGDRLGHGKGYYDKFFAKCSAYRLAICYDEQIIDEMPTESHDIPMNEVITNLL